MHNAGAVGLRGGLTSAVKPFAIAGAAPRFTRRQRADDRVADRASVRRRRGGALSLGPLNASSSENDFYLAPDLALLFPFADGHAFVGADARFYAIFASDTVKGLGFGAIAGIAF